MGVPEPPTKDSINLITLLLTKNTFSFCDKHYLPLKGMAMGTCMTPLYVNILMGSLKRDLLASANTIPSIWWRYTCTCTLIISLSSGHTAGCCCYIGSFPNTAKKDAEMRAVKKGQAAKVVITANETDKQAESFLRLFRKQQTGLLDDCQQQGSYQHCREGRI